jgi:hypothetical protein
MKNKKILSINSLKTIKQIIISHTIFLALFAGVALALAQDATLPTPPANPETAPEEISQPTDNKPAVFENNLSDRKVALQERTRDRIINLSANMSYRLEAASGRLQNIIVRLESRLDKIKAEGRDTTEAEGVLAKAQDSVGLAISEMSDIDESVASLVGSATVQKDWALVKQKYINSHQHIKEAHALLRETVTLLKTPVNIDFQDDTSSAE